MFVFYVSFLVVQPDDRQHLNPWQELLFQYNDFSFQLFAHHVSYTLNERKECILIIKVQSNIFILKYKSKYFEGKQLF